MSWKHAVSLAALVLAAALVGCSPEKEGSGSGAGTGEVFDEPAWDLAQAVFQAMVAPDEQREELRNWIITGEVFAELAEPERRKFTPARAAGYMLADLDESHSAAWEQCSFVHDVLLREAFEFKGAELVAAEMRPAGKTDAPWVPYDRSSSTLSADIAIHLASVGEDDAPGFVSVIVLSNCLKVGGRRYFGESLRIIGVKSPPVPDSIK